MDITNIIMTLRYVCVVYLLFKALAVELKVTLYPHIDASMFQNIDPSEITSMEFRR